jgi:HprK-related kinase B
MTAPDQVETLRDLVGGEAALSNELRLRFDAFAIRVRTNDAAVAEGLRTYFGPFVEHAAGSDAGCTIDVFESPTLALDLPFAEVVREAGKSGLKEAYCDVEDGRLVRKTRTGMLFAFGCGEGSRATARSDSEEGPASGLELAIGPCAANLNQVINFINSRYVDWRLAQGGLLLHAAGVVREGCGLVLAGFPGAGKSTLALHLLPQGYRFVSNDRVIVAPASDGSLDMFGLAKLPRVNPGTILHNDRLASLLTPERVAELQALSNEALWELEDKYDVDLEQLFGPDVQVMSAAMSAIVILNWRRDASEPTNLARVDLRTRRDLLPALMKSPGVFHRELAGGTPHPHTEDGYLQMLGEVPTIELTGAVDFAAAVEALDERLTESCDPRSAAVRRQPVSADVPDQGSDGLNTSREAGRP